MTNLFSKIATNLLQEKQPSHFLQRLLKQGLLDDAPFDMLSRLTQVEQSNIHHPEGNVWNHTMLVVDEAARLRDQSNHPDVLMWAALLHDIGKASATKRRKGKITAYDHDKIGADMARAFLRCFTGKADFIEQVAALVRWHMQLLFVTKNLPFANLKAMIREADVHDLALLGLCDRLGRKGADESEAKQNVLSFLEAVTAFQKNI